MRIPRRGVIAQKKAGGYVWAVYSLVMGIDESAGGTSGSFSLSSSRYKQAAKSYTVSSDGTISLVNSTQTTAANMAIGDYLVNVSTSNNTSTTGTTLYKITAISGSFTRTITYTAYTPTLVKGEDTGERVESLTQDYPIDGLHTDGKWYVMLKGSYIVYVWDVFNVVDSGWKTVASEPDRNTNPPIGISSSSSTGFDVASTVYYTTSSSTVVISSDGYVTGFDQSVSTKTDGWYSTFSSSTCFVPKKSNNKYYYKGVGVTMGDSAWARERYDVVKKYTQGSATGETAESVDASTYPQNDAVGNYWYVYSHSYEKIIDNT